MSNIVYIFAKIDLSNMAKTSFKDFIISFLEKANKTQKQNLVDTHRMLLEYYVKNYFFENKDETHNLLNFFNNNSLYLNESAIELGYCDNDEYTTQLCDDVKQRTNNNKLTDFDILTSDVNTI